MAEVPAALWAQTDADMGANRMWLQIFEDGREIGSCHSGRGVMEEGTESQSLLWTTVLYFITSDGSDPNGNGRSYSVVHVQTPSDPRQALRSLAVPGVAEWHPPDRPLRCAVLGLGNRGGSLARLIAGLSGVQITWLVDHSQDRLAELEHYAGGDIETSADIAAPLADPNVDAVLVTLPDHLHRVAAEQAFRAGKDVYLEKPVATTAVDARAIMAAWQRSGRVLQIGYVLRAAPFYQAVREVVRKGFLGPIRVVSLSEQLDALHGASFMRRWHGQSANSGGLIVHKSCHDLDLICWLLDTRPRQVASFGGLDTFRGAAPASFCSQCAVRPDCIYADSGLHERRAAAEHKDPTAFSLDRCVYRADKDVVDNQVVSFELESGARGTFYLATQGHLGHDERQITLIGDVGRLEGSLESGRFTIDLVGAGGEQLEWSTATSRDGHGGGDRGIMVQFLNACAGRAPPPVTSASEALSGLVFALAAEEARLTHSVVTLGHRDFAGAPE
jgi:predicted dehydrogenase